MRRMITIHVATRINPKTTPTIIIAEELTVDGHVGYDGQEHGRVEYIGELLTNVGFMVVVVGRVDAIGGAKKNTKCTFKLFGLYCFRDSQ